MDVEEFLRIAATRESYESLGRSLSTSEVRQFESELDVSLTDGYRQFVQKAGWVSWFGVAVFGFSPHPRFNAAHRTASMGQFLADAGMASSFPERGNVVAEIFGGGFCFLHSGDSPRAGQVSAHAPDELYREVHYWSSFEDYATYLVDRVANWHDLG